jgi:hypothetical protein
MYDSCLGASNGDRATGTDVVLVFEDRSERGLIRILRPGFRHCFCLIRSSTGWLLCDPLKRSLRLEAIGEYDPLTLAEALARNNRTVLLGTLLPKAGDPSPRFRPITCVEIVKRVLGLSLPGVLTPHQLFQALVREDASLDSCRTWQRIA